MAPNFAPGVFKIVSLIEGSPPAGVNFSRPAGQSVHLNAPVTTWVVRKEGHDSYRLSVGGYSYTGVIDDKVTATVHAEQNVEWHATYRKHQDAYTIEPVHDQSKGWTIPPDHGHHAVIDIRPIIVHHSLPPRFLPTQLFRFEAVDEDG